MTLYSIHVCICFFFSSYILEIFFVKMWRAESFFLMAAFQLVLYNILHNQSSSEQSFKLLSQRTELSSLCCRAAFRSLAIIHVEYTYVIAAISIHPALSFLPVSMRPLGQDSRPSVAPYSLMCLCLSPNAFQKIPLPLPYPQRC